MKIMEAKQAINQRIDMLDNRRYQIQELLREQEKGGNNIDRVELHKELEALDKAYDQTSMESTRVRMIESAVYQAESAKRQAKRDAEAQEELRKYMELFRRIARGDKVPIQDEQRLMLYDSNLYMMAKCMASIEKNKDEEEHDSLWKNEEKREELPDVAEVAGNTEVSIEMPEMPAPTAAVPVE